MTSPTAPLPDPIADMIAARKRLERLLHPTPLLCSVCEQPIRVGQRCYTVSICRALVRSRNEIGPFGGWGSEPEPTFCARCMGTAAEALERLHEGWRDRWYCDQMGLDLEGDGA